MSSSIHSVGSGKPERNHSTSTTRPDYSVFGARFSRCRRLLHFIATRVLGGLERADEAVENCWLSASHNSLRFQCDGAFCSWLVRVLIDEALAIRCHGQDRNRATLHSEQAITCSNHSIGVTEIVAGRTR